MTAILIGLSTPNSRIEASLRQRGATPVLLDPYFPSSHAVHGIVLPGNKYDVPPHLYGQQAHPETFLDPDSVRTNFETALISQTYRRAIPLLAICGGAQLLNVVFGGTLTQHLPEQSDGSVNHRQAAGTYHEAAHSINVTQATLLHKIAGESETYVNSDHHQAIHTLGRGFRLNARATDGTIEGIEHSAHPFLLGVQWHPEYKVSAADGRIFDSFVSTAANTVLQPLKLAA